MLSIFHITSASHPNFLLLAIQICNFFTFLVVLCMGLPIGLYTCVPIHSCRQTPDPHLILGFLLESPAQSRGLECIACASLASDIYIHRLKYWSDFKTIVVLFLSMVSRAFACAPPILLSVSAAIVRMGHLYDGMRNSDGFLVYRLLTGQSESRYACGRERLWVSLRLRLSNTDDGTSFHYTFDRMIDSSVAKHLLQFRLHLWSACIRPLL
jgi:hypothetical protein